MNFQKLCKTFLLGSLAIAMTVSIIPNKVFSVAYAETNDVTVDVTVEVNAELEDTTDYLFAYFPYTSAGGKDERIYLGMSEDGFNYSTLNNASSIIESKLGTHGLRDPFIIRSAEGDKYYMLATDLNAAPITVDGVTYPGRGFNTKTGSHSIMVWESTDLVNWTDQRMCDIAVDNAGCTWAPEAFWDETSGQYIVFWASTTNSAASNNIYQNIYYCTTSDFHTYSDPQIWINFEDRGYSVIDTTLIKEGDTYYRYTKREATYDATKITDGTVDKRIFMETSDSLFGTWTMVNPICVNVKSEGPTIYKLNSDDSVADKWCLLVDNNGSAYVPTTTTSLSAASPLFSTGTDGFSMPKPMASHGTVIPVTSKEFNHVMLQYNSAYAAAAAVYVEAAKSDQASLSLGDTSKVTSDITLTSTADNGSEITWSSSNPSIISDSGHVTRPTVANDSATVILTATITQKSNGETIIDTNSQNTNGVTFHVRDQILTKEFTVNVVPGDEPTTAPSTTPSTAPSTTPSTTPTTTPTQAPTASTTPTTSPSAPAKVTGLTVTNQTTTSVHLKWNSVADASGYCVQKYNSTKNTWTTIKIINTKDIVVYKVPKLTYATDYSFRVYAFKSTDPTLNGEVSAKVKAATAPKSPIIKAKKGSSSIAKIHWTKSTRADGYIIYMKTGSGNYVKQSSKNAKTFSYTKKKLKKGKKYTFIVKSFVSVGSKQIMSAASSSKSIKY